MPRGTLQVVLVSAKGLEDNDFLSSIDPYVILSYRAQEHKSTVKEGAGSNPQWNEIFLFTVSDSASELNLKIMEKDNFNQDDFLGEAIIPIDVVVDEGSIPETVYNVVKNEEYCGEIKLALTFNPEPEEHGYVHIYSTMLSKTSIVEGITFLRNRSNSGHNAEESYGGWTESNTNF